MRNRPATYVDLLGWALATTEQGKFAGEPAKWHGFVHSAKKLYPELFQYVLFDLRDPARPFSDEAAHALHVLAQAGVLSVGNPSYRFLQMDDEQRLAALTNKVEELGKHKDTVERLAEMAKEQLAV